MSRLTALQDRAFALAFSKVFAYEVEWDGTAVLKDWVAEPGAELPYLFGGEGNALLEDLVWNWGRASLLIDPFILSEVSLEHRHINYQRKFISSEVKLSTIWTKKANVRRVREEKIQTRKD